LYALLVSPMRPTCSAHLDFITNYFTVAIMN
jgi:hypothetical protein